jgi:putative nucleotidyltransferase with HDIG domain
MCKLSVLFVDDDARMLSSLGRLVTARHLDWAVRFVTGGRAALNALQEAPCDVVVCDADLHDMSGSALLAQVKDRWPLTLRVLLTEQMTSKPASSLLQAAHQLLAKPCPADQLVEAVESACSLRCLYMNEAVLSIVHRLEHLPVLPRVYMELVEELRRSECSAASLGTIIARDMGLAAGILKLINSPYFGLSRRVESPQQAVSFLGVGILQGLVIYEKVFKTMDPGKYPGFNVERLWAHCLDTARCLKAVAKSAGLGGRDLDQAFNAGLLHDIGKVVLAEGCPGEFAQVLRKCQTDNIPLVEAEAALLGVTHAEVGAYVLGLWGFPRAVVDAIAGHHEPCRFGSP